MNFRGIDLNLLVAFDALMRERNVTRAAAQVGVSQPAMSAALGRLRKLLGDPLFRRSAEGLAPTPRAHELAEPIAGALRQIEETLLDKPKFDPDESSMRFTLGLSDYPSFVLLPALAKLLEQQAPGVSLNVQTFHDRDNAVDLLDAGTIDVAVGVLPTQQDRRIRTQPILQDDFVTILSRNHPAARSGMDLDTYLKLSHVLVSPEGDRHGLADEALARQGKQRRLSITLPDLFAAPSVVAQTHLAATVLKRVALNSSARRQLVIFPPPIALPTIVFNFIWHRGRHDHPAQQWLRQRIADVASAL